MKKILVIREGALGDLILTFPVFSSLKRSGFFVGVAGNRNYKKFIEKYAQIDIFIPVNSSEFLPLFSPSLSEKFEIEKKLSDFDIILCYSEKKKPFSENLEKTCREKVIWHPVKNEDLKIHITDYLLLPVKTLCTQISKIPKIKIKRKMPQYITIHPGSGSKKKNWEKENYAELIEKIGKEKVKVLLGPAEETDIEFWKNFIPENLIVNPDFDEIIKIAERTKIYIGNDSGITHLFAATGIPVIAIFGPTSPDVWGPRGENVKIIYKKTDCSPCNREKREKCVKIECLRKIKIEDVLKKMEEINGEIC